MKRVILTVAVLLFLSSEGYCESGYTLRPLVDNMDSLEDGSAGHISAENLRDALGSIVDKQIPDSLDLFMNVSRSGLNNIPIGDETKSTAGFTTLEADSLTKVSDGTPWDMTDGQWTGKDFVAQAGEDLIFGKPVFKHTDGKWYLTDADSLVTMCVYPAMALATINADAYGLFLREGYICEADWTFDTIGNPVYPTTTTGGLSHTAPSTTNNYVQPFGSLEYIDIVYFDPSRTLVKRK